MKSNKTNIVIVSCVGLLWLILTTAAWLHPAQEISVSERRVLAQFPETNFKTVFSGQFMDDFEAYTKDQYPDRFGFRSLKAISRVYLLAQMDNNDIYVKDGYAAKLEYPLNEKSIQTACDKFRFICDKYLKPQDLRVFVSVIPDKNYYLGARQGYPSLDYDRLFNLIETGVDYAEYIDITEALTIADFYRTDIHWKQENLGKAAGKIAEALGIDGLLTTDFRQIESKSAFYGVYAGQSALPLQPDRIICLTNDIIESCTVYNAETDLITPVYDTEKSDGRDPYDIYLSGAAPLLVVENPQARTDRELVVFRDSFGSSLVPLLLEGYAKVTLIDIRYMSSDMIGKFVDFDDQDVLFLYNTLILNSAVMLK